MPALKLKIPAGKREGVQHAGGMKFAFFFAVVLIASINTGNNLTYLVLSALCAAVLVSWTLAALCLGGLSLRARLPDEVFAGEETRIDFLASKRPGPVPAVSLSFSLRGSIPLDSPHRPYLPRLSPGEEARVEGLYRFPRRGRYPVAGPHVVCNFPFGLTSLGKLFRQPEEIVVYPRLLSMEEMLESGAEGYALRDSSLRGRGGGLLHIRPFVPGDDYRSLHWKATAKMGRMMLKEFAKEEGQAYWLHFNPLGSAAARPGDEELFELGASAAASLAYGGRRLGLRMLFSAPRLRLAPGGGRRDSIRLFLDYLAVVEEQQSRPPLEIGYATLPIRRREDAVLIVIDPLNDHVDWGPEALVLDKPFFRELRKKGVKA